MDGSFVKFNEHVVATGFSAQLLIIVFILAVFFAGYVIGRVH